MDPDNQTPKAIAMVEIEERLLADADGSYRKELAEKLAELDGQVQVQLRAMNAPAEYGRLNQLAKGIEAATKVLDSCCRPGAGNGG